MRIPTSLRKFLAPLIVIVLFVTVSAVSYNLVLKRFSVLVADKVVELPGFPQISGIVYWPERSTLIGVGDGNGGNSEIAEFTPTGRMIRSRFYVEHDLEDIVLSSENGYAYVTNEQARTLADIRLSDFAIVHETAITYPRFPGQRHNHQFEGVVQPKGGSGFVFANEEFPAGLEYFSDLTAPPKWIFVLGAKTVSSVITDDQGNLLVVSRERGLLLTTPDGRPLGRWHPVRARHIEGAALVPGVGLILCTDHTPGELLIFSNLDSWEKIRHVLSS
jgi:uncharacterized protein YjiK